MTPQDEETELTGRVVRLHFRCHAELPIGSSLRVTGSTLWAPGTAAWDPAEAAQAVGTTEASAFPVPEDDIVLPTQTLYSSSVEMVTTPDEYPIWRTRKPVVIVIHNSKRQIQHHYYRYLVVSPGGSPSMGDMERSDDECDDDDDVIASTSNEIMGSTPVMQWEDPFGLLRDKNKATSSMSLTSSMTGTGNLTIDYRNLPYRVIDIDVKTGKPTMEDMDEQGIRLDKWNNSDDASYRPYLIRQAIMEENQRKNRPRISEESDSDLKQSGHTPMEDDNNIGTSSRGTSTPPVFSLNNRIFFVCYHLPVVVVQNQNTGHWRASWSESILAKTEGSKILSAYEAYWVGTVTTHPPLQSEQDKEAVRSILQEMNCIPIFLEPNINHLHYYGFCKQVLWPAFHNIDLLDLSTSGWLSNPDSGASDWDQSRLEDWWNAYQSVNQEFSNVMTGLAKQADIIWIHDYHLSLLPRMFSSWEVEKYGRRVTRKVFFLHIPFPTSQIFRELECGEEILQGMLYADVVGFHAFDHARHFLNAAKRILGLNYESLVGGLIGVNFHGSTVLVTMSNVSIESRMVDAALMLPSVQSGLEQIREKHKGRTILAGVDVGQRLSGISLKLLAYERFLKEYPSFKDKVVLLQRMLLPGSRKMDENVTANEVRSLVSRIRETFGTAVIDYEEIIGTSPPMDQRLALWKAADILICTPVREGLNHWPMEYVYAHKETEKPGIVITSEFSAVSSILNGALRVNPYDIQMTVSTIEKSLTMDMTERVGRRYRDIDFVSSSPSDKWVNNVLRDLRDATSRRPMGSVSGSQSSTPHGSMTPMQRDVDSTAAFLARESSNAFCPLHLRAMKRAYDASSSRVIITDFNGTIVMKEPPGKYLKREILGTSGNKPPQQVIDALEVLSQDPRNTIYVVSGDAAENVLNALGHLPSLGLAVSNGAQFSPPVEQGEQGRQWYTFDLGVDWEAVKRVALPVLSKYTARTNGSFVKLTSFSIGWSYYSCDPEWGSLQAAHLVLELENELRAFDVRFVTLKGIVEVVPRKLNKGLIVKNVLSDAATRSDNGVDFVLCLGDDISDEKMFTSVFTFLAEIGDEANLRTGPPVLKDDGTYEQAKSETILASKVPDRMYCFTVAVGKKATHASCYVNGAQDVANALVMLATGDIPYGGVPVWGRESAAQNIFV